MAIVKSSRPVLALEDLEEMDGISLDDMISGGDEPIRSPFIAAPEPGVEEDPFSAEPTEDTMAEISEDVEAPSDDLGSYSVEPDTDGDGIELDTEPVAAPEPAKVEKPKRTRTTKPKVDPAPAVEDSAFTVDDLDSVDSMPDTTVPSKVGYEDGDVLGGTTAMDKDPIEAMITPVGDVPEWMTMVVYGKNGTGKTTFGASGKKTLVIEVEKDGTFSVRDRGSEAKKYPVKSWDDFENIYWYLKKHPGVYDIVCIDTLTRLSELCMRSVVLNKKAEGAELLDKDLVRVTLPQYGDIGKRMTFWLNAFADLPCHKVWLCQEASGSDDKDVATVDAYPALSRAVRIYVCSDATIIGRTEIKFKSEIIGGVPKEIPQFILRVAPSSDYLSKDRTKSLGAGLLNPKIDKLITKVYE